MLERTVRAYQNRAIETAQVITELIELAGDTREAYKQGEDLGVNEDELAFYDALCDLKKILARFVRRKWPTSVT